MGWPSNELIFFKLMVDGYLVSLVINSFKYFIKDIVLLFARSVSASLFLVSTGL